MTYANLPLSKLHPHPRTENKLIALLSAFAPFLSFAVVSRLVGPTGGLVTGAAVSLLLLTRDWFQRKRTLPPLESGSLLLFGSLAAYSVLRGAAWSIPATRLFVDAGLFCIVLASLALRQPFTLRYARERVSPEIANTPAFLRTNYIISAVWAAAFALLAGIDWILLELSEMPIKVGIGATILVLYAAARFSTWYPARTGTAKGDRSVVTRAVFFLLLVGAQGISARQLSPAASCESTVATAGRVGVECLRVQSGAEPGATDPMNVPAGRYSLFPVQDIGAFVPTAGGLQTQLFKTDSNLNLGNPQVLKTANWNPYGYGPVPSFAVAGKILSSDHDNVVTATGVGNIAKFGSVEINFLDEGYSTTLPDPLLPAQRQSSDFIAVAQGDLDRTGDKEGNNHNEVVVVHVSAQSTSGNTTYYRYNLDVLNYASGNVSSPDITSTHFVEVSPKFNLSPATVADTLPSDNILSVSVGDFDGDGRNEIAVVVEGQNTLLLYTYRYETVNGVHSLHQLNAKYWPLDGLPGKANQAGMRYMGTLASAAGDFDGDGSDELAVAYGKWGVPPGKTFGQYAFAVHVIKYDKNLQPDIKNSDTSALMTIDAGVSYDYASRPVLQLVSGQFLLHPPDIKYGRRQFALAFNDTLSGRGGVNNVSHVKVFVYKASDDLSSVTQAGSLALRPNFGYGNSPRVFSVAAAGLAGNSATNSVPSASLAVGLWSGNPHANPSLVGAQVSSYEIATIAVTGSGDGAALVSRKAYPLSDLSVDLRARLPLVAYDREGKSMYLGEPLHLTIYGAPKLNYILQEPPKHLYWDESTKKPVNFTRFDGNNVSFSNSSTTSLLNESKNETNIAVGSSTSATAQATATVGGSALLGSAEASVTAGVTEATSYDYREHKEQYNSGYLERITGSTGGTDRDDLLIGTLAAYDVWRYRIFGAPKNGNLNTFFELVLPGAETTTFKQGGRNFDWYQPIHENGNILSYPSRLGSDVDPNIPSDMGEFSFAKNGPMVRKPLVNPSMESFDGTSGSSKLAFATDVTQSGQVNYWHTMGNNLSIFGGVSAKASFLSLGVETSIDVSTEFQDENSWGKTATTTETTKTQTDITLNRAAGQSNVAYPFFPVLYNTTDGTLKMAHAVPNPAGESNHAGQQMYRNLYGGHPDPALNLPSRFYGTANDWVPDLTINRKQMRGLFLRSAVKNPATGSYDALSRNVQKGETVRIEPRVYNFSTGFSAYNTTVQFQVIPYDSAANREVCDSPINAAPGKNTGLICPQSARTVIGQVTIPDLEPLQFTCVEGRDNPAVTNCKPPAFINWDTANFGLPSPGTMEYRIYVVLNPTRSAGDEIYAEELAPVHVTNVTADSDGFLITAPNPGFHIGDYVNLGGLTGAHVPNGIFQIASLTTNGFRLGACEPAPPCSTLPSTNLVNYTGGGTATVIDPGQNNEGYGQIGITTVAAASSFNAAATPHDFLEANSLQALDQTAADTFQTQSAIAYVDRPVDLRFTAFSSQVHSEVAHLLLYDGDPAQGGALIADKFIHPGAHAAEGTSVWVQWIPSTAGVHQLHAVLLEGTAHAQQASLLQVNVLPAPATAH